MLASVMPRDDVLSEPMKSGQIVPRSLTHQSHVKVLLQCLLMDYIQYDI